MWSTEYEYIVCDYTVFAAIIKTALSAILPLHIEDYNFCRTISFAGERGAFKVHGVGRYDIWKPILLIHDG